MLAVYLEMMLELESLATVGALEAAEDGRIIYTRSGPLEWKG